MKVKSEARNLKSAVLNRSVALLLVALGIGAQSLAEGQETNAPVPANSAVVTNGVVEGDEPGPMRELTSTNEFAQADELSVTNEAVTNDLLRTNLPSSNNLTPSGPRPQAENRDAKPASSERGIPDSTAAASTSDSESHRSSEVERRNRQELDSRSRQAGSPGKVDFSAFRLIAERNIFDPNRRSRRSQEGPTRRPASIESFSLVGIMSYDKGTFAFFDGTSSRYKKVLKLTDEIAGFKLAGIQANSVKLNSGAKEFEIKVGMQLRREDEGEWRPSAQTETYDASSAPAASSSSSTSTSSAASAPSAGGSDSEVLKRLMQRRDQE